MNFEFDINKSYEIPLITLCNPDFSVITDITNITNLHRKPRFNAVSEVNFDVYKNDFYDSILKNRLLKIQGFGYFVIASVAEINEGISPYKSITAYSYEYTLNSKGANIPS